MNLTEEEKKEIIDEVVKQLSLQPNERDKIVQLRMTAFGAAMQANNPQASVQTKIQDAVKILNYLTIEDTETLFPKVPLIKT